MGLFRKKESQFKKFNEEFNDEKFNIEPRELEIKTKEEFDEAKKAAEVISEKALVDKLEKLAIETKDEKLLQIVKQKRKLMAESGAFYSPPEELEIKTKKELSEAKREASVSTEIEMLIKAEEFAEKTNDKKLLNLIIERKKSFFDSQLKPVLYFLISNLTCYEGKKLAPKLREQIDIFLKLAPYAKTDRKELDEFISEAKHITEVAIREDEILSIGAEPYFCAADNAEGFGNRLMAFINRNIERIYKLTRGDDDRLKEVLEFIEKSQQKK